MLEIASRYPILWTLITITEFHARCTLVCSRAPFTRLLIFASCLFVILAGQAPVDKADGAKGDGSDQPLVVSAWTSGG